MTTAAPPRPAARRGAAPRPKPAEIPFRLIFEAFPADQWRAVQIAIDALVLAKRGPSVLRVNEYLAGILPATVRPPCVVTERLPPIAATVNIPGAQDEDAIQAQHIARYPTVEVGRLRKSDFRARVAWAESLIASGADLCEPARPWLTIDGWGCSPRANRYESEDTWRFRLAELFAPQHAGGCE